MRAITARFSDALLEDAMEDLTSLMQTGSLRDYCRQFDALLNKVTIYEEYAVSIFLKGLKTELRCPVNMFRPKTLHDAYSLARLQEITNSTLSSTARGQSNRYILSVSRIPPPASTTGLPILPTPSTGGKTVVAGGNKPTRLTSKDIDMKRAMGECFWCSERFVLGHICKKK